ncbi:hypothetical protein NEOKW01_0660 [Nematocida sp. AWRm80]|nr:hypothetical protein NEOKW01_0660 [Nematocida sp. AWRm80]
MNRQQNTTEELQSELLLLRRILYKHKNTHRNTIYYRKISELLKNIDTNRAIELSLEVYTSISSNIALGHNLGLSILVMASVSKVYTLLRKGITKISNIDNISKIVKEDIDDSTDEIDRLFKKKKR